jgi:hypothetical protein
MDYLIRRDRVALGAKRMIHFNWSDCNIRPPRYRWNCSGVHNGVTHLAAWGAIYLTIIITSWFYLFDAIEKYLVPCL